MFELFNQADALFQADKSDRAESLALEALQQPEAQTNKNLTDYAMTILLSIWMAAESYQKAYESLPGIRTFP